MPAGIVIAALAVIALVALAALFLFGGSAAGRPGPEARAVQTSGSELAGQWLS